MDCQIDCQARGYVDCKADLQGTCEVSCEAPEGALFCDGQYVDHGNNLEECINALEEGLEIEAEASASGEASGEAEASCAMSPAALGGQGSGALLGLLGLGWAAVRRRRNG
jgi:MYXO-CTERM domain-containing protein